MIDPTAAARRIAARTRAEQGLPERLTDPATLGQVAALIEATERDARLQPSDAAA